MEVVRGSSQGHKLIRASLCRYMHFCQGGTFGRRQAIIRLQKGHLPYTRKNFSKITRREPAAQWNERLISQFRDLEKTKFIDKKRRNRFSCTSFVLPAD